jgi:iron(III) transport system permease protein
MTGIVDCAAPCPTRRVGPAPHAWTSRMGERAVWLLVAASVAVLVAWPLLVSFDAAFRTETRFGLGPLHSLEAMKDVYTSPDYLDALGQTVLMSGLVTALAVAVGVAIAVLVARTDLPFKPALDLLVTMPLFLSPFTGLIAWVALGSAKTGFLNTGFSALMAKAGIQVTTLLDIWTFGGAVWVMFLFFMPFVYLFTVGSLRSMDGALEEAARTVGASPLRALWRVSIPLSLPGIMVSALVVFMLAAETYTIPGLIGNSVGFTVLSWQIFEDVAGATVHQAHAAAAATMLVLIAVLGLLVQRHVTRNAARYVTVSGKGFSGRLLALGRWRWPALLLVGGYVLCATVLPMVSLLLSSVLKNSTATLTADQFTWRHYLQFAESPEMRRALLNTGGLAVGAGLLCAAAGFVISFGDVRRPGIATRVLAVASTIPVAVPGLVYGVGFLWLSLRTPFYGTVWVLLFAYLAKFVPFGVVMSRGGLQQIHPDLEGSARMCGATPLQAIRHVTLPLMKSTLIAIAFSIVLLCVKELSASVMLYTTSSEVLSVLTWHYMDSGNYQFAAAVGVVQTAIMVGMVLLTRVVFGIRLERSMGGNKA